jgi:AcrR family transcriptional regulator
MPNLSAKGMSTKERILYAAFDLFQQRGMHATSAERVLDAAGVGKGQFYHYFASKNELIHAVLRWQLDLLEAGAAPISSAIQTWDTLRTWFAAQIDIKKHFKMERGCPFGTAAGEVTEEQDEIRQDLMRIFDVERNALARFFAQEKVQGRLAASADEGALASFCIAAVQGAMLLGKIRRRSDVCEAIVSEALKHLSGYRVSVHRDS